jgi:DNA-binding NarL/FixJ family response regulator
MGVAEASHMEETSYSSGDELDLAVLWAGLRQGKLFVASSRYEDGLCWATIEVGQRAVVPSTTAMNALERVLAGEQQKVVAADLGRAIATIAGYCAQALRTIAYERTSARAPMLLLMAVAADRGAHVPKARLQRVLDDGSWLISVAIPGHELASRLSPSEWEVARAAIEGKTHAEIALARGTSPRTVANQLASVFGKTGTYGCFALRARAAVEHVV